MTRIAFYAPLKPPDHPIPSGDRQMARMLLSALTMASYDVFLASRYISYSKRHGADQMATRKEGALAEAAILMEEWRIGGNVPDLWFCYHPYDKSPDWLGIEICTRLGIPMVTAEPCKTGQGPNGEWLPWRSEAQKGIAMAALNIVMTHSDHEYVSQFVSPERIAWLSPFLDAAALEPSKAIAAPWPADAGCRLLSVGMMRPGAKLESYRVLAEALKLLEDLDWALAIVGGGPGEDEVRNLFQWDSRDRVAFAGELAQSGVFGLMAQTDVLAWPGCREAYGMVYLEAAAHGAPAAALNNLGVPLVVEHERTGLLADPPDVQNYADVLTRLITDPDLRRRLGEGARRFVENERSGAQAAARLRALLDPILAQRARKGDA